MSTNITKKAAGAENSNGLHTATNGANFPTDGAINQAPKSMVIATPPIPQSPNQTNFLEALRVLCVQAGVFSVHSLTAKKRNEGAMGGATK